MDLYLGGGGACLRGRGRAYIQVEKYFNLQSVKFTFLSFSSKKHVFRYFSRSARCKICSKLTIKTSEYVKLKVN